MLNLETLLTIYRPNNKYVEDLPFPAHLSVDLSRAETILLLRSPYLSIPQMFWKHLNKFPIKTTTPSSMHVNWRNRQRVDCILKTLPSYFYLQNRTINLGLEKWCTKIQIYKYLSRMSIQKTSCSCCYWVYEIIDITALFINLGSPPFFAYLICIVHPTIWKTTEFPYGLSILQLVDMLVGILGEEWR